MKEKARHRPVQSVERALELLEAVARTDGEISITALATRTRLHVSTVHRLLATLVEHGYVAHDQRTRRYRAGERLRVLATRAGAPG